MSRAEIIFYLVTFPIVLAGGWWARKHQLKLDRDEEEARRLHRAFRRARQQEDSER